MAQKRTSDVFEDSDSAFDPVPIAKKPKHAFPSLPPDTLKEMHQTELEKLSHEDLVAYVISLQGTLRKTIATLGNEQEKTKSLLKDASKKSVLAPSTANNLPTVQSLTPAQLILRADKLADMCRRGIKKEMIWKPSCKTGRAKWSFSGVSPTPEVFFKMLRLPSDEKPWKQKIISRTIFEDLIGDIDASARYSELIITSDVNVKWFPKTNEFSFSGKFGKYGTQKTFC